MGPPKTFRIPLRVVFYREDADWIAHCLEFDLIGDGTTKVEALKMLIDAIILQMEHSIQNSNSANLFSPADGKFFEMFAAGHDIVEAQIELTTTLERLKSPSSIISGFEVREYGESEEHDPRLALA
jgi:hypothetical protein